MINGMHAILFSTDAEADRNFLRDVLGFAHVDDGQGWLIFKLPPSEVAVHPIEGAPFHQLSFMVDDIAAVVAELRGKGVEIAEEPTDHRWGIQALIRLPSGAELSVYQPRHAVAKDL